MRKEINSSAARRSAASCPENVHISECSLGWVRLKERVEQKYYILPHKAELALALLRRVCRYDPEFAREQINSLYFDTWDLDQHQRSDSGEFTKDKIRIRWYGDDLDPVRLERAMCAGSDRPHDLAVTVWLELKSRQGFSSTKQRRTMEVTSDRLALRALGDGIVPGNSLTHSMAGFGFFAPSKLVPIVAISYFRHRFIEPRTGFRVSLDSHIHSSMVRPGIGLGERGLELPGLIVEVKGPSFQMPDALRGLLQLGTSWTRYSKYSSSLDAHAADLGTVSRLWPAGTMVELPGSPVRLGRPGRAIDFHPLGGESPAAETPHQESRGTYAPPEPALNTDI